MLTLLAPFARFKKIQADSILKISKLLQKGKLDKTGKKALLECILKVQENNYVTKRKKTRKELMKVLGLTP